MLLQIISSSFIRDCTEIKFFLINFFTSKVIIGKTLIGIENGGHCIRFRKVSRSRYQLKTDELRENVESLLTWRERVRKYCGEEQE